MSRLTLKVITPSWHDWQPRPKADKSITDFNVVFGEVIENKIAMKDRRSIKYGYGTIASHRPKYRKAEVGNG
jgi:hypothetical protein